MSTFSPIAAEGGFYGRFGGAYIPEILLPNIQRLEEAYRRYAGDPDFQAEYRALLRDYVGRPTPLYRADRLSRRYGTNIYLKREDLNHTGAHKINNAIGSALWPGAWAKRIIAETGAGQHGVATATVCALMGLDCVVYMGATDVARQRPNVERMKMLGAKVVPVSSGNSTLKDATNEAIRDWCCHPADTFYIIGSTVGPYPYPEMVARFECDLRGDPQPASRPYRQRAPHGGNSLCRRREQCRRCVLSLHRRAVGEAHRCRGCGQGC